ncbi:ubiquinol-cytochrome c reductase iron-sulfur subunit [Antrihabitans stalactiti]|uniref:Cytochrome bc1 complex Rieske iron-sulfur subunit n=1 Tax=Antrihabitans stalactiti TaxID=2584121 RepID=A0A848KRJ4_9NOCA|nr:Rieske (2Fe-2S) protein [Antrihabitans stalactiti]NMN98217.1 Rieske (2Fe-2S) protein [Antrihabitans stalactiti]
MQHLEHNPQRNDTAEFPRRTIVAGIGVAAATLAAASALSNNARASAAPATSKDPKSAPATVNAGDIPVGGGAVLGDVVVTQPSSGDFRGFSATCPHAGCNVSDVSGGTINCPCHGSKFNLDGSVRVGPASAPLAPRSVSVQGDSVVIG